MHSTGFVFVQALTINVQSSLLNISRSVVLYKDFNNIPDLTKGAVSGGKTNICNFLPIKHKKS